MTDRQFWTKADQITESKKTIEEKADLLAQLLQVAYRENLRLPVPHLGDHLVYMNLDENHANTIGNRCVLCYSSKRKAEADLYARSYGMDWAYVHVQEALNSIFNKAATGYLVFNCYLRDQVVAISKETLMKYIPGPYPVSDGFVDVPVSGYPVIPEK